MIESPWLKEILEENAAETLRGAIATFLTGRFGTITPEISNALAGINDPTRLQELILWTVRCPDLDAFRSRL